MKQPLRHQLGLSTELIIDSFAGGGGGSTGIEQALGHPVHIAINHDAEAVALHAANHPYTKHFCEDVWEINPRDVEPSRQVGLLWASPDCKHFSKAKGGKPVSKRVRGLAWVAAPVEPCDHSISLCQVPPDICSSCCFTNAVLHGNAPLFFAFWINVQRGC
jgi:hypothetical protein